MIIPKARLVMSRTSSSAFSYTSLKSKQQRQRQFPHNSFQSNSLSQLSSKNNFLSPTTTNSFQGHYYHQHYYQNHIYRQSRMSTSLAATTFDIPELITSVEPIKLFGSFFGVLSIIAILKYRGAITRRYRQLREESWIFGAGVTMERIVVDTMDEDAAAAAAGKKQLGNAKKSSPTGVFQNLKLMELSPEFQEQCKIKGHQVISLGDYMEQLRPKGLPKQISVEDTPKIIQREIEAGLAAGLLKVMGPNLGRALLPAVGAGAIQRKAQGLAGRIATKWFISEEGSISESQDKGGIPVGLMTLLAISDTNAKINSGQPDPAVSPNDSVANLGLSAIDKMKVGEVVKGPTFAEGLSDNSLIPNDFIVSNHFDRAIQGMEDILAGHDESGDMMTPTELKLAQNEAIASEGEHHKDIKDYKARKKMENMKYDPEDRRVGEPVPVNPRLFPGLYLGWGDALNSHTKREVVKMRLLSLLLNRLGANYYRRAEGEPESSLFQLRMNEGDKPITTPWEFVQLLQDAGHKVEVVPTSRMTTFGLTLCVKEKDNSWSNVPLGVFLETGYEDKDGNMAPAMMPHSGLDMFITGPLAGNRADGTISELRLQHFVGIEGFCGWHPHSNPEVPFNEAVERGPRLGGEDAVRAARIAGLYAICLNGLATEMELPFGGYGLTAVCNDSAAVAQQCLYGVNTIYPMTSIGRFMLRTMRYAERFQGKLRRVIDSTNDDDKNSLLFHKEIQDLSAITQAMKKIPSDLNASPSNAHSAALRLIATLQPSMPLRLMEDSKKVMESILEEDSMSEVSDAGQSKVSKVAQVEKENDVLTNNGRKR